MKKRFSVSKQNLSEQLLVCLGLSFATVGIAIVGVSYRFTQASLHKQVHEQAQSVTRTLEFATEGPIAIGYTAMVQRVVENYATLPTVLETAIINPNYRTVAHSNQELRDRLYTDIHPELTAEIERAARSGIETSFETTLRGKSVVVQILPFSSALFGAVNRRGLAITISDLHQIQQEVWKTFLTSTITMSAGLFIILLLMAGLIQQIILSPLNRLNQAVLRSQATGRFIAPESASANEIQFLATTFKHVFEQRRQAEASVQETKDQLQAILDNSPAAIYLKDQQGRYLMVNRHYALLLQLAEDQMIGKTDRELFLDDVAIALQANDQTVMDTEISQEFEEVIPLPTGEQTYLSIKFPLYDRADALYAVCAISTNITERKQTEEQTKTALQEKEVLLAEIHHRVKNNLQIVYSLLRLQMSKITDSQAIAVLQESQNRIRAMSLIHERLYQAYDFTQIDFAKYLHNLASELIAAYQVNGRKQSGDRSEAGIGFTIDANNMLLNLDTAIPCSLIANELITNALKYAFPEQQNGEIRIAVTSEQTDEQIDRYTLTVQDNGVGLPEDIDEQSPKTFGLKLVQILTRQLRGKLTIQRDAGTIVTVTFSQSQQS